VVVDSTLFRELAPGVFSLHCGRVETSTAFSVSRQVIANRSNAEWRNENREKCLEYNKQYSKQNYAENREIILEKLKETITCECGCVVNKYHLQRHKRTKKHLSLIDI
jgi:hypothetical protein